MQIVSFGFNLSPRTSKEKAGRTLAMSACVCVMVFSLFVSTRAADESPANASATTEPEAARLPTRQLSRDDLLVYLDAAGKRQTVKTPEDWQHRRQETDRALEAILGPLPGKEKECPLDVQIEDETDAGNYIRRRITYQSEPGSRVPAYLLIPKSALQESAGKVPAVLCLHPTSETGPNDIVGLGPKPYLSYPIELAERGYVVLAPNYPLLGIYQPDLKQLGWESGMLKAVWDNMRGMDLLDSLPFVRTGRYAAIGHSLGGHNSIYTGYYDQRIQAVISSCGMDSMVDYYNGNPDVWLPGKGWVQTRYIPRLAAYRNRLDQIPYDFQELIAGLAPRPVLIVAPLHDGNFRADSVDRVVAAARPVFDQIYAVGDHLRVLHPDEAHTFSPEMRKQAYQLIDSVLQPPAK